jgi:hypothetical protein
VLLVKHFGSKWLISWFSKRELELERGKAHRNSARDKKSLVEEQEDAPWTEKTRPQSRSMLAELDLLTTDFKDLLKISAAVTEYERANKIRAPTPYVFKSGGLSALDEGDTRVLEETTSWGRNEQATEEGGQLPVFQSGPPLESSHSRGDSTSVPQAVDNQTTVCGACEFCQDYGYQDLCDLAEGGGQRYKRPDAKLWDRSQKRKERSPYQDWNKDTCFHVILGLECKEGCPGKGNRSLMDSWLAARFLLNQTIDHLSGQEARKTQIHRHMDVTERAGQRENPPLIFPKSRSRPQPKAGADAGRFSRGGAHGATRPEGRGPPQVKSGGQRQSDRDLRLVKKYQYPPELERKPVLRELSDQDYDQHVKAMVEDPRFKDFFVLERAEDEDPRVQRVLGPRI